MNPCGNIFVPFHSGMKRKSMLSGNFLVHSSIHGHAEVHHLLAAIHS
jgi:hypothetical protein